MVSTFVLKYFCKPQVGYTIKTNLTTFHTVDPEICSILLFPAFSSPQHLVCDFSRKIFLILYSNTQPKFIVWLLLLLEILGNIYFVIICFPVCNVINFEINLSFLIKLFSYVTKKSKQMQIS